SVEIDFTLVRPRLAGDDVHHRGFAGAVWTDDRAHLAGRDGQRQVVDRLEAVKGKLNSVEVKHLRGRAFILGLLRRLWFARRVGHARVAVLSLDQRRPPVAKG